jgi:hypothetical protein
MARLMVLFAVSGLLVAACGDDDDETSAVTTSGDSASDADGDARVREAQELLAAIGCEPGAADGVVGPSTTRAIERFQATLALPVTGELDDETLAAIRTAESEGGQVCTDDGSGTGGGGSASCPEGEECLVDPSSVFSSSELELSRDLVARAFSVEAAANCEGVQSTSEVGASVEFNGTSEGLLEGYATWEARRVTVPFSHDTGDQSTVFLADVCVGVGE